MHSLAKEDFRIFGGMSKFIVSARKYRPQRFDSVVGQGHVSTTLKNAMQNDQLAHAFLFCGPRGVGKTTCARILAKVINCQNLGEDYEACNTCNSCSAFNENASFNITELDAASNNSVEHIRALIEQVRFQPQQGKYKVFIIDEVHMLSQQAFNAFLKTLEEPPPYAIFILATTEKHKIIPTILSRCQIFDFRRIQVPDMIAHLQDICKEESIDADKDALHIIAQKADGALRDALSIFDRMVSFSGKSITYEDVITNLNVLDYDYFFKIVDAFLIEDISTVLLTFDDILRKGFEADLFINGLANHLRNLLVCKDEQTLVLLEVSDALKKRYAEQARKTSSSLILSALNIANESDVAFRMARNKRLHVEMAIIKMVYLQRAVEAVVSGVPANDAVSVEKKTLDESTIKQDPAPAVLKPVDVAPVEPKKEVAKLQSAPPPETKQEVAAPEKEEQAIPAKEPALKKENPTAMPSLGGKLSLEAIDEEVIKEDEAKGDDEAEVSLEDVIDCWSAYAQSVDSPSLKNTLINAELTLEELEIKVLVGSTMKQNLIQQDPSLMEFLKKELNNSLLTLSCTVDPNKKPETLEKPKQMTPKEIYDQMKQENEMVEEMRKRFDLGIDQS